MLLRDPVHGLIEFDEAQSRVTRALLATKEMQRLRSVRQMGLASLVFPGAEHSRFAHALGTAHVMACLQRSIAARQQKLPIDQPDDEQTAAEALAAALLHDLGHGPFSHLFEVLGPSLSNHEQWTQEIILSPTTEVHQALEGLSEGMAQRVVQLLQGSHPARHLVNALSGTLDVDRCDYLLRDSHMSGVRYGLYDLSWLLRSLTLCSVRSEQGDETRLVVDGRKGLPSVEEYFVGRHFMYQQVYHHKAVRAADALVTGMFKRLRELALDGAYLAGNVSPILRAVASGAAVSIEEYLALDDPHMFGAIASWEKGDDPLLADLAQRFRRRLLPKTLLLPSSGKVGESPAKQPLACEALARACEVVERSGMRADLHVSLDVAAHEPYREQESSEAHGDAATVWVHTDHHQPLSRLGDASVLLGALRNRRVEHLRLIFPAEHREAIVRAVSPLLLNQSELA